MKSNSSLLDPIATSVDGGSYLQPDQDPKLPSLSAPRVLGLPSSEEVGKDTAWGMNKKTDDPISKGKSSAERIRIVAPQTQM